jgi:hypothetical protein
VGEKEKVLIGDSYFDLSRFGITANVIERLPLIRCKNEEKLDSEEDRDEYIEIGVKIKSLENQE